jgi:hypothetical protein
MMRVEDRTWEKKRESYILDESVTRNTTQPRRSPLELHTLDPQNWVPQKGTSANPRWVRLAVFIMIPAIILFTLVELLCMLFLGSSLFL